MVGSLEELDGDGESCAADSGGRRFDGSCASGNRERLCMMTGVHGEWSADVVCYSLEC